MMKKILFGFFTFISLFFASTASAAAVPVRTYPTANPNQGTFYLKSENAGNGNLNPGANITVDSYLFQCRSKGKAACSTEWNSDAVFIQKYQNTMTVPALNQKSGNFAHAFTLPLGRCGRIQYDQGIVGIEGAVGGVVYDFGVDCPNGNNTPHTPTPTPQSQLSCSSQGEINTEFRVPGKTGWTSGTKLSQEAWLVPGTPLEVNCFARTGASLLEGGYIEMISPQGQTSRVSNTGELRNFSIPASGTYTFVCKSATINNCSNSDTFSVPIFVPPQTGAVSPTAAPVVVAATARPTATPVVTVAQAPAHRATCDTLQVVGGNDSLVPAKVTLRARGTDNKGNIQKYRFYFGDGEQQESDNSEITHEYKSSGNFIARVDIKDSQGNWKTSGSCDTTVRVKATKLESHKAACSNVHFTANNNGRAPAKINFDVTGYDNKGDIQQYKLDFGNGIVKESNGRTFEELYTKAGTYEVRAYVKNSAGNWVGGEKGCRRTITIGSSQPLTTQPATGTPTVLPLLGIGSTILGLTLEVKRRRIA